MTFKEQIALDNKTVFMNFYEFSDFHLINGVKMPCIIDNNELVEREKRNQYNSLYADGLYIKQLLIYVKACDFGPLPAIGRAIVFDKKSYIITDAIDEDGIYSLCLEANKS